MIPPPHTTGYICDTPAAVNSISNLSRNWPEKINILYLEESIKRQNLAFTDVLWLRSPDIQLFIFVLLSGILGTINYTREGIKSLIKKKFKSFPNSLNRTLLSEIGQLTMPWPETFKANERSGLLGLLESFFNTSLTSLFQENVCWQKIEPFLVALIYLHDFKRIIEEGWGYKMAGGSPRWLWYFRFPKDLSLRSPHPRYVKLKVITS